MKARQRVPAAQRFISIRVLTAIVLAVLAFAPACGGGDGEDASAVLAETADKLGEIRSGELEFSLIVDPRAGEEFGFELRGPFELARNGGLPQLDVDYTQIASGRRATVTLVSDGREAYAQSGGRRVELSAQQLEQLRSAGAAVSGGGGQRLPIDDWIVDPEVSDGGEVGGAETDKVEGRLDVVAVANRLIALARGLGRDLRPVRGRAEEQLRDAVESSSFELHTGKDDRLLRRVVLEADLAVEVQEELRRALGEVVGARIAFRLGITNPNQPIEIEER